MKKIKQNYKRILFLASIILLIPVIFFTTRGISPAMSELSFIEKSTVLGKDSGFVVPASCEGSPWISHFSGDCNQICSASANPLYVSNTVYDFDSNTCVCANGRPDVPTCIVPTVALTLTQGAGSSPYLSVNLSIDSAYVAQGDTTTVRWAVTGTGASCTASGSWTNANLNPLSSGTYNTGSFSPNYDRARTYALSCTNGTQTIVKSVYTVFEGLYVYEDPREYGCFVAGTKVLMADGSKKNIEDVTSYDSLMTSDGPQEVMKRYVIPYKGKLYAFNNSRNYFVTPTHPFMTTEGWKSLDPEGTQRESPGIQVSKLEIGDNLVLHGDRYMTLTSLDSVSTSTTVYNFGVNGTHDFYADDYLVHNVSIIDIFEKAYAAIQIKR